MNVRFNARASVGTLLLAVAVLGVAGCASTIHAARISSSATPLISSTNTAAPQTRASAPRSSTTRTASKHATPTTHRAAPKTTSAPAPQPTPKPATSSAKPAPVRSSPRANCDPAYPDACLHDGIGDYDCAGGSGNGPNYIAGPIRVRAPDPFRLDADHDGVGCEG
jgi:hypothetical protein